MQSIVLFILILGVLATRRAKWLVGLAIVFIVLSIPLYALWIFFTAQLLVYFAFLALILAVILIIGRLSR